MPLEEVKSVAFVHAPCGVVADEVVGEPFPRGGCAGGSTAPYQGGFVRDLLLTTTHRKSIIIIIIDISMAHDP